MAMTPNAMASAIQDSIDQIDKPDEAINNFYKALCDYVEGNAQVFYAWAGVNPSGTPDPQVVIESKIKTSGSLSPSGANDPSGACSSLSSMLNTQIATWMIEWPAGFALSPALVIPNVNITPSQANSRDAAWLAVCTQIIAGIKLATPAASGAHAAYTGAATFTSIL